MKQNDLIDGAQTVLVFKDQIGHFFKFLDVFGITPNLKVGYCNLLYYILSLTCLLNK